jgi:serine/threonine-protein kinase HipA
MNKCLYCYHSTDSGEFHPQCAKKIFGITTVPKLPYTLDAMESLAREIIIQSVSVTGVQAKLSLHLNPETKKKDSRFTLVGLWGNYILKPPAEEYPHMPEVEDCTMHLAELFRIPVVPHTLIRLDSGELAYLTRRIDRNSKNNKPIHMEDFCQLSGKLTEHKYRGSMESIGKLIRKYSSNALFDLITFFEVTLFSFLTGNGDMHLKNFSLIHNENGQISLTPAYDLLSTRIFISEKDDPEEMALTLNGKKRKFTIRDIMNFGQSCSLSEKQIANSLGKFRSNYGSIEAVIKRSFLSTSIQDEYLSIIENRIKRLNF